VAGARLNIETAVDQASFDHRDNSTLLVRLSGAWRPGETPSSAVVAECESQLSTQIRAVAFKADELISWDSSVIAFVERMSQLEPERFQFTKGSQENCFPNIRELILH
jgi:hypothetical protein